MAVVVPMMGPGMAGTQLSVSARSLLQASRYARTMAILHQADTELVLTSAQDLNGMGLIEVRAASQSLIEHADESSDNESSDEDEADDFDFELEDEDDASSTNAPSMPETTQMFDEEISSKFECKGISFIFEGYDDIFDGAEEDSSLGDDEIGERYPQVVLRYNSNGSCRPFSVRVCSGEELSYVIKVNAIGVGKIEEYGDEEE